MEDPPPLRLALIDQHNWRAALAVQVTPDQLRYVAGHQPVALVILAKAYVRPGDLDWEPLAVTAGASVLGVVALAHASTHTELLHLAVDARSKGKASGRRRLHSSLHTSPKPDPARRMFGLRCIPRTDVRSACTGAGASRPTEMCGTASPSGH